MIRSSCYYVVVHVYDINMLHTNIRLPCSDIYNIPVFSLVCARVIINA